MIILYSILLIIVHSYHTSYPTGVDQEYILECCQKFGPQDVAVLIDEMKVREGLVYNNSGALWGYVDTTEADSLLDNLVSSTNQSDTPLATHALCLMIRGLKSDLQAVVATYGTHALTAENLHSRFWDVVANLELVGFSVRCCVSDGASINRKFYKMHADDYGDDVTYRATNRFAISPRPLYLISDTCHLMKTSRNGFENSGANRNSRKLVVSNVQFNNTALFCMYRT